MKATRASVALALAAASLIAAVPASAAEVLIGATAQNKLVTVHSDSPWSVRSAVALRGLSATENVIGLDIRPRTGAIYAATSAGRLVTIDPVTGETTAIGGQMPTSGTFEGFSIDPRADLGRIVTDSGSNRRVDLDSASTSDETPLAYSPGDPGSGIAPRIYTAAFSPGSPADLYGLDQARGVLVRQDPVSQGRLHTIGPVGFSFTGDLSQRPALAIADSGAAYAALQPPSSPRAASQQGLYRVDLATGRATASAPRPAFGASLTAMTAAGTTPDDRTRPQVVADIPAKQSQGLLRRRGVRYVVSCSEACIVTLRVALGAQQAGRLTDYVQPRLAAGVARGYIQLNRRSLRMLAKRSRLALKVRIGVSDGAGNRRVVTRLVRR